MLAWHRRPYEFERSVTDSRLLDLRGFEIAVALDSIAPSNEDLVDHTLLDHALLIGPPHSGRTSTLREVARRAVDERNRILVRLRPTAAQLNERAFVRHLLLAAVEAVAMAHAELPGWYLAWRERVYLRRQGSVAGNDLLSSALVLASDPDADIDPVLLTKDLSALGECASACGANGLVVTLDDASDFTADTSLVEFVITSLDEVGGWSLLLAGLPTSSQHFVEAASPCLRRFRPVHLAPFDTHDAMTCLTVPLEGAESRRLMKAPDVELAADLVRLTGGNPFEIMLVAHHMWLACQVGENDRFALTPRVLDRVVHELALHTSGGEDLLEAARAIRRLDDGQMPTALELVASHRLTVRQIAAARVLGVDRQDGAPLHTDITSAEIDQTTTQIREELSELEEAGVLYLRSDDNRFEVRGGRPVSVLLKYEAQAAHRASDRPFGLGFLVTVGRPLIREAFSRTAQRLGGARRLGSTTMETGPTRPRHGSPRQAVGALAAGGSLELIARGDLSVSPTTSSEFDRVVELVSAPELPEIALVSASVASQSELEYAELWELPVGTKQHELSQQLAAAFDELAAAFEATELRWRGAESVALTGEKAHETLILLQPIAADSAITRAYFEFESTGEAGPLARAVVLADYATRILRSHQLPLWQQFVLSTILSRAGFLKAFDNERLAEAEVDLRQAQEIGPADSWVTDWNLANVLVRQGRHDDAVNRLARVPDRIEGFEGKASVVFFVPGVDPRDCLIGFSVEAAEPLLALQRGVIEWDREAISLEELLRLADACDTTTADGALKAAEMVKRFVEGVATVRQSQAASISAVEPP